MQLLTNEAIRFELLHRACRRPNARGTTLSVAAPTSAAAVAAAAAAAVDTEYHTHCASIVKSSATKVMFIVQVDREISCTNIA